MAWPFLAQIIAQAAWASPFPATPLLSEHSRSTTSPLTVALPAAKAGRTRAVATTAPRKNDSNWVMPPL